MRIVNSPSTKACRLLVDTGIIQQPRAACQHFKEAPLLYKPAEGWRPDICNKLIKRLHDWYEKPRRYLKSFNKLNPCRKKRSERCEAAVLTLSAIIEYLELCSLRLGTYNKTGEFRPLTVNFIHDKINQRRSHGEPINIRRVQRALGDLVKAGYLTITRQFRRMAIDNFIGLASIRELTPKFFYELGVHHKTLTGWREWKRKQLEKKIKAPAWLSSIFPTTRTEHSAGAIPFGNHHKTSKFRPANSILASKDWRDEWLEKAKDIYLASLAKRKPPS